MNFDAEIDAELNALSDCSSNDEESFENDVEDVTLPVVFDKQSFDWMQLFINRANEQSEKFQNNLCDVEIVLQEVDKNVREIQSQASFLPDEENRKELFSSVTKDLELSQDDETSEGGNFHVHERNNKSLIEDLEKSCQQEIFDRIDLIEAKRIESEKEILEMEEVERKILNDLLQEKLFYENERRHKAACCIQCSYRRYLVRRQYGAELDERLKLAKEERTRRRIRLYDERNEERKLVAANRDTEPDVTELAASQKLNSKKLSESDDVIISSSIVTDQSVVSDAVTIQANNQSDALASSQLWNDSANVVFPTVESSNQSEVDGGESFFVTAGARDENSRDLERGTGSLSASSNSVDDGGENKNFDSDSLLANLPDVTKHHEATETNQSKSTTSSAIDEDLKLLEKSVSLISNENDETQSSSAKIPAPPKQDVLNSVNSNLNGNQLDSALLFPSIENSSESYRLKIEDDIAALQESVHLTATSIVDQSPDAQSQTKSYDIDDHDDSHDNNIDDDCLPSNSHNVNRNQTKSESNGLTLLENSVDDKFHKLPVSNPSRDASHDTSRGSTPLNDELVQDSFHENEAEQEPSEVTTDLKSVDHSQSSFKDLSGCVSLSDSPLTVSSSLAPSISEVRSSLKEENITRKSSFNDETCSEVFDAEHVTELNTPRSDTVEAASSLQDVNQVHFHEDSTHCRHSDSKPRGSTASEMTSFSERVRSSSSVDSSHSLTKTTVFNGDQLSSETKQSVESKLERSPDDPSLEIIRNDPKPSLVTSSNLPEDSDRNPAAVPVEDVITNQHQVQSEFSPLNKEPQVTSHPTPSKFGMAIFQPQPPTPEKQSEVKHEIHSQPDAAKDFTLGNIKTETGLDERSPELSPLDGFQLTGAWKRWKKSCICWETSDRAVTKPQLRRTIRKSSAAKKLPPFSEEEIVRGRWPFFKEEVEPRAIDSLSRVYLSDTDSVGKNLINIQRCANLTHLSLLHCGLVSVECLQSCPCLKHIDVSHNQISVVSCDAMKRLESLVAINNRLTSIHGLSGCSGLLLLDLSDNNITKIHGLDDVSSLAHLRLSNNQLMNITGLNVVSTLVSLDVSFNNLSSLEGIENCGLLRFINTSNNSFSSIPRENLKNSILLVELDLSGNNISEAIPPPNDENDFLFLPLLTALYLQCNKITLDSESDFPHFLRMTPNIRKINLSKNLISNCDLTIEILKSLSRFSQLILSENLFSNHQEDEIVEKCSRFGFEIVFDDPVAHLSSNQIDKEMRQVLIQSFPAVDEILLDDVDGDAYSRMVAKQLNKYLELITEESKQMKNFKGWKTSKNSSLTHDVIPPDLFARHCDYLKKHFEIAAQHRLSQESRHFQSSVGVRLKTSKDSELNEKTQQKSTEHERSRNDSLHSEQLKDGEGEVAQKPTPIAVIPKSTNDEFVNSCVDDDAAEKDDEDDSRSLSACNRRPAFIDEVTNSIDTDDGSCPLQSQIATNDVVATKREDEAASRVQAAWRGHAVRMNMKRVFASFHTSETVDTDEFEEVDLSELEFDENAYEQQWAVRTQNFPAATPPVQQRAHSAETSTNRRVVGNSAHVHDGHEGNIPEMNSNSQSIWQKIASIEKPPLPPITPTGSTVSCDRIHSPGGNGSSSLIDSHRSKHSRREEVLASEWGFHSSTATELMLKRARRMKGRKKKQANAEDKLKRFQDLKQKVAENPLPVVKKPHPHSHSRVDYFKAREIEFEKKSTKSNDDDERRRQYTYEWLHTSANANDHFASSSGRHPPPNYTARRHQSDSGSIKSGFLPHIPQQRSATDSEQNNDLEILSMSSQHSSRSRSKHLLRDIARRHGMKSFDALR